MAEDSRIALRGVAAFLRSRFTGGFFPLYKHLDGPRPRHPLWTATLAKWG
jgi:hypothetical protein